MANINGNNIDDLFRQASDKYPLRTDSSDWGRLSDSLDDDPSLVQPMWSGEGERRGGRRLLWLLLLLLPVAGAGYLIWQTGSHRKLSNQYKPVVTSTVAAGKVEGRTESAGPVASVTANANTRATGAGTINTADANTASAGTTAAKAAGANSPATGIPSAKAATTGAPAINPAETNTQTKTTVPHTAEGKTRASLLAGSNAVPSSALPGLSQSTIVHPSAGGRRVRSATSGRTAPNPGIPLDKDLMPVAPDMNRAITSDGLSLRIGVQAGSHQLRIGRTDAKPVTKLRPEHHLYVGLFGSPDLSTVRMQKVSSVGTTYGVLVGYTLSKRWSLESGLSIDHKKYYTEGQYFNKEKVPQLNYIDLKNVDGNCNMLEVPVNIRYNLGAGDKIRWFATAGLSTYFMSSEWYDYQGWSMTGGGWVNHASTYHNPSQNWFSIINVSVGFEQKLGSIGNLRLEPYLRVPLSGMGTGSLPIMSAGLNIGITRRIW